VLAEEGKLEKSIPLAREVLEKRKKAVPESEAVGRSLLALARMLITQGEQKFPEAERLLDEAPFNLSAKLCHVSRNWAAQVTNALGGIRLAQKSFEDAEKLLLLDTELLLTPTAQMSR
jgi:ATP/maltotriose-dependent transcriptional regulator MalT